MVEEAVEDILELVQKMSSQKCAENNQLVADMVVEGKNKFEFVPRQFDLLIEKTS